MPYRPGADVPQGNASVEGGHDESGSEYVGINDPDPGPLADGTHPAMGCAPVEAPAILSAEDPALGALADDQVEGPGCSRDQRDDGWLVALLPGFSGSWVSPITCGPCGGRH